MNKSNQKKLLIGLVLLFGIAILLSNNASLLHQSIIGSTSLTFNFDSTVSPWELSKSGAGALATFAWSDPADPHARLTCSSYDPSGWVGAVYFFDSDALSAGSSYTVTFWYTSNIDFIMQYISWDVSENEVDRFGVVCPASSSWTQKTLNVNTIQDAAYSFLSLSVSSVGTVDFDSVQISLVGGTPTATPTPTPTATPTQTPTPIPTATPVPTPTPIPQVSLIVGVSGSGTTTPTIGEHIYDLGSSVYISATPNSDYTFDYWLFNDGSTSTVASQTITLSNSKTVLAVFTSISSPSTTAPTPIPTAMPTATPTSVPTQEPYTPITNSVDTQLLGVEIMLVLAAAVVILSIVTKKVKTK